MRLRMNICTGRHARDPTEQTSITALNTKVLVMTQQEHRTQPPL